MFALYALCGKTGSIMGPLIFGGISYYVGQRPAILSVAGLFAIGAVRGAQGSLQGLAYRHLVRPRLAPPTELEDPRPPRFAQTVGLVITGTGLALVLAGVPTAGPVAAAVALVAAFLNAAFGLCLGCEMYLILQRVRPRRS